MQISLASDSNLSAGAQTSGNDILFTDSTGTNKLSHEIETYVSTTGKLIAWVQVPTVSPTTNTVIYMYYGNASASPQQNPTAVWDSNYTGVWHFPSGSSLSLADSTSNGNNGTNSGATASTGQSQLGGDLLASSGYASVSGFTGLSNTPTFTVETWAYFSPNFYNGLLGDGPSGQVPVHFGLMEFAGTHQVQVYYTFTSTNNWNWASTATLTPNTWNHIVVTCDTSSECILYLNGAQDSTTTVNLGGNTPSASSPFSFGTVPDYGYLWGSGIDEVRTSKAVRSGGWITTEYNNQNAPASFYNLGSQQTNGGGGTVAITVTSVPVGLTVTVDGQTCAPTPCTYAWPPNSGHTLAAATQAGGTGTQYVFVNWTGGAGSPDAVTAPSSATTYTATFTTQYRLTTSANPSSSGTITPSSEWVTSGSSLSVNATDNSSSYFTGFSGGTLAGTNTPQTITTMTAPATVVANFGTLTGSAGPPSVSGSPSAGSGTSQAFTYVASSPNGSAYIGSVQMYLNWSLSSASQACYLYYAQASNLLYLMNDGASSWSNGVTPGTSGTLNNSQCQINIAAVTVSGSGDNLTITVPITFMPAFLGPLQNWADVFDVGGATSNWTPLGTWTAYTASTQLPTVNQVTPNSGSGIGATFQYSISDVNGYRYIGTVDILLNTSLSATNACYLSFYPASNTIYLWNNSFTGGTGGVLGTVGTLSNSQCQLNLAGSSMSGSGNNLTLAVALTFTSSFSGTLTQYVDVVDHANNYTGFSSYGTWTAVPYTLYLTQVGPLPTLTAGQAVSNGSGSGFSLIPEYVSVGSGPGGPYWVTGTPPLGLTLWSIDGGYLFGFVPVGTAAGNYPFTITVTDSSGVYSGTIQLTLAVVSAVTTPSIATSSLPNVTRNAPYSATVVVSGGLAPYVWQVANNGGGQLPNGISLSSSSVGTTATLSGTTNQIGSFQFTLEVTDNAGHSATKQFTLTVASGISITPTSLSSVAVEQGVAYNPVTTFVASGGSGSYTFSAPPNSLPPGLTLSSSSGALSGTPTTAGTYSFTVSAVANGVTGTDTVSLTVAPGVTVTTSSLPSAMSGTPYSQPLSYSGGVSPYTWSYTGTLPSGISLTGSVIGGTTSSIGNYPITVRVQDAANGSASAALTLKVVPNTSSPPTAGCMYTPSSPYPGQQITFTATASGLTGTPTYSWSGFQSGMGSTLQVIAPSVSSFTESVTATDSSTGLTSAPAVCVVTLSLPTVREYVRIGNRIIAIQVHQ